MHPEIWLNGSIVALDEARLSPASAGALYGWGVFTTLGVARSQPRAFEHHWERLVVHAERARVPLEWERDAIESALLELIARAKVADGRARITLLRARAGLWQTAGGRDADAAVFVSGRSPSPGRDLALTVSPYRLNSGAPMAGIKTTAYVEHLAALDEARERGFDEAIMLNERGEVVEATAANLFWARGGELFTPALQTGCLAGVTRRFVLEAASRLGIRAFEGSHHVGELHDADEIFLTNSGWGLAAVAELDIHRFDTFGPLRARLAAGVEELLSREGR